MVPEGFAGQYTVAGQKVTVTHAMACRLGYLNEETHGYMPVTAEENPDGSYTFIVPDDATEVVLVVLGDLNEDGKLSAADVAQMNAYVLGKLELDPAVILACDVNSDGLVNFDDITILIDAALDKCPLVW